MDLRFTYRDENREFRRSGPPTARNLIICRIHKPSPFGAGLKKRPKRYPGGMLSRVNDGFGIEPKL